MTYKTTGTSLIAFGALIVTIGSQMSLSASLTSQGTYLGTQQAGEPMWIAQEVVLPAAAIESSNPAGVLAFGMLMMLIGFGLHALWTIQKNTPRNSRKQMEVIWVERTIRL